MFMIIRFLNECDERFRCVAKIYAYWSKASHLYKTFEIAELQRCHVPF